MDTSEDNLGNTEALTAAGASEDAAGSADSADSSETVEGMCDLVEEIAALLVDAPDDIELEYETVGSTTRVTLSVAPDDLGRVLGKQGRTARAMRTVLAAASSRLGHAFVLDVAETA